MSGPNNRPSVFGGPDQSGKPSASRSDFWNPTLNIRFVEGHCVAFLYSHMLWMNFDPSRGIILHFSTHTVKVAGRNLAALYTELLELRCRQIVVLSEEHDLGEADAVVVHRVGIRQESPTSPRTDEPPCDAGPTRERHSASS